MVLYPYNVCVPNNDISSIIKNKKNLERHLKVRSLFKMKNEIWTGRTKLVYSYRIKLLVCSVSRYDYSASVINRSFKQWWLRRILEENTKLPTDVINHCIFPYLGL